MPTSLESKDANEATAHSENRYELRERNDDSRPLKRVKKIRSSEEKEGHVANDVDKESEPMHNSPIRGCRIQGYQAPVIFSAFSGTLNQLRLHCVSIIPHYLHHCSYFVDAQNSSNNIPQFVASKLIDFPDSVLNETGIVVQRDLKTREITVQETSLAYRLAPLALRIRLIAQTLKLPYSTVASSHLFNFLSFPFDISPLKVDEMNAFVCDWLAKESHKSKRAFFMQLYRGLKDTLEMWSKGTDCFELRHQKNFVVSVPDAVVIAQPVNTMDPKFNRFECLLWARCHHTSAGDPFVSADLYHCRYNGASSRKQDQEVSQLSRFLLRSQYRHMLFWFLQFDIIGDEFLDANSIPDDWSSLIEQITLALTSLAPLEVNNELGCHCGFYRRTCPLVNFRRQQPIPSDNQREIKQDRDGVRSGFVNDSLY